jgi:hypothetical protein
LGGAEFNSANLHRARFSASIVEGAQFTGADLSNSNFDLARTSGANFDLSDVRNVDKDPLEERAYNAIRNDLASFAEGGETLFQMTGDALDDAIRRPFGQTSITTEGKFKLCDVESIGQRENVCVTTNQVRAYAQALVANACDSEVEMRGLVRRVFLWRNTSQLIPGRHLESDRGTLVEGGLAPLLASGLLAGDCPGVSVISDAQRDGLAEIEREAAFR